MSALDRDNASFKDMFLFYLRLEVSPDDFVSHNVCAACNSWALESEFILNRVWSKC